MSNMSSDGIEHGAESATIVDVAARAGVSTATVSRVLNGKTVRPDLTAAVREAAKDLNYLPNRAARTLRRRLGEVIGLILPNIENPFYTSLARGVEDVAQRYGYSVVLCNSDDDLEKEAQYLRIAVTDSMAGVIICPADSATSLNRVIDSRRFAVVVDREAQHDVDQVLLDNVDITRRALQPLLDAGFSRIGCVTGPSKTMTARIRAETWRRELLSVGLTAPNDLLVYANFRVDGGRRATEQLLSLQDPPDAILATNNLVGVGALRALAECRPERTDIGVSVIGSLPFATSRMSDISTIHLHPRQMGMAAAEMLMERVMGSVTGAGRRVVLADGTPAEAGEGPDV